MPWVALHTSRRFPVSSSDTDHNSSQIPPVSLPIEPPTDVDMSSAAGHYLGATPEHTRFQHRRMSTLSYQNSGARDFRDRTYSRSSRNLVVVIPSSHLPLDQGQLGHVLSTGPSHRLSQGILMPLFPSMLGQLNAIAREYNFPSTVGLCLYLHINEHGIIMTPRISYDSWQYLFSHLFDAPRPSGNQLLPISGSIEFDIDLNKARWFDAWVSGTLRELDPVFQAIIAPQASLEAHWRGESQTINTDEQPVVDAWNSFGSHTPVTDSRPETLRHPLKKLSLVDRLELHGVHMLLKPQDRPDSPPTYGTYASSPILQSDIPQVAESDLERRVNSWRATTELHPVSVSVEEANRPVPDIGVPATMTTIDERALEHNFRKVVNMDEFLWSVTSAGPRSPAIESQIPSSRPSSVHLDRRARGSVPLTPVAMTSWDPIDGEWHPFISKVTRLRSPDVGERVVEDVMALRPRAVWGNSFGWRSTTTWKQVYPYSFIQAKPTIQVQHQGPSGLVSQYPNLVIYPVVDSQSDSQPSLKIESLTQSSPQSVWGSSFGWHETVTWRKVYPYSMVTVQSIATIQLPGVGGLVFKYPNICIYPALYPYFEIYPASTTEGDISRPVSVMLNESNNVPVCYPNLVIYPNVHPYLDIYPRIAEGVNMRGPSQVDCLLGGGSTLYPNLVIYPAIYPRFDLCSKALQVTKTHKHGIDVRLVHVGCLIAEYPNITIYPGVYPYLEIYPTRDMRKQPSSVAWDTSFGWLTANTWTQVYPLYTTEPLTVRRRITDPTRLISRSGSKCLTPVNIMAGRQAVWGSSFGWKGATTWRAVWPAHSTRTDTNVVPISVQLEQQSNSFLNYPYLIIYPAAYPHINIYPSVAAIAKVDESRQAKENNFSANLNSHDPNLVIYPAVYPHFDLYPAFERTLIAVKPGNGGTNLCHRRIETWRAKMAAQIGLNELLANNHTWEVDEPLQLDLADYTWSRTSAGPCTSPLEPLDTSSIPGSVHIDRRIQGSVLPTPSTATTWNPQDDDWYSEINSVKRLPSPDLGQRILDDVENIKFPHQPWHMVWPFFSNVSHTKTLPSVFEQSISVSDYPQPIIYSPTFPHFDLYPTWANVSTLGNHVTESLANPDVYPAVYPHFNVYPVIELRIDAPSKVVSNVQCEQVEVRLAPVYPNLDIYQPCYPYNLDYIYPSVDPIEATQISVEGFCGYPFTSPCPGLSAETSRSFKPEQLPSIYPPRERKSVNVKLSICYPSMDLYPAGYPWSLKSIYPTVSIDDHPEVVKLQYSYIGIHPAVYPFVQPYPSLPDSIHIPGTLDEGEYEVAKVSLALPKYKPIVSESAVYPHFDLYPTPPMQVLQQGRAEQDVEVSDLAYLPPRMHIMASVCPSLEKQRTRSSKMHQQLHTEVFQDGIVWTPSGYVQDLSSLITSREGWIPVPESQQHRPQDNPTPRSLRSRSGTMTAQSPDEVIFPLRQPPALSPLRACSPGVPSQSSPAVSETPMPRVSSPSSTYTHMRTSTRLSQTVKSMTPGRQRRSSSATLGSPSPEDHKDHKERAKSPTKFLSLVDGRPTVVPPVFHTPEFLTRAPRNTQTKENLVLQRARAYEQSIAENQTSGTVDIRGTHFPFVLQPLSPMPPMTEVAEAIEKSKITFP